MTPLFRVAIVLFLLGHVCTANTIDCTAEQCQNTVIDCMPNQNCFVSCDDTQACIASTINCPTNGDCDILCSGGQACHSAVVNATSSVGNFNLLCEHSADDCKGIRVYGSTLVANTANEFNILCDGSTRSCAYSHIECPSSGDCSISCNSDTSCHRSQISGPSLNGDLSIHCNGEKSCFDAILNGKSSSSLHINGCRAYDSCTDLTLYCPPHTNEVKNCFMEGNDNIARDLNDGTMIYATNGFDDIEIDYFGTFGTTHGGYMFCGDDYALSCDIKSDDWSCADADSICNSHSITRHQVINSNATFIYAMNTETLSHSSTANTILYTTTDANAHDSHDDNAHDDDDEDQIYYYQFSKDRGITWLLEVRIVFGCGVLFTILMVGLCCYLVNKHRHKHDEDDGDAHKVPHLTSATSLSRYSRTYTHHSYDNRQDRHPYDERSKTMEIDDTYQLNKICAESIRDGVDPFAISRNNTFTREHMVQDAVSITPPNAHAAYETDELYYEQAQPLNLNPIQAEIAAVRQEITLRNLVLQKENVHNRDISVAGSADTTDIMQRNMFSINSAQQAYVSCSEGDTPTHSVTVSPKTPMLPNQISSTMTTFNLNDIQREESRKPISIKPHLSPKKSFHQRTKRVTIKSDVVMNEIVNNKHHKKHKKRHKPKLSSSNFQLQCPSNQKSVSINNSMSMKRNKSPSSKNTRKITLLSMTTQKSQRSYGSIANMNDSETEMESGSESSKDKTKTSTRYGNEYSETDTYEASDADPIPTAC